MLLLALELAVTNVIADGSPPCFTFCESLRLAFLALAPLLARALATPGCLISFALLVACFFLELHVHPERDAACHGAKHQREQHEPSACRTIKGLWIRVAHGRLAYSG